MYKTIIHDGKVYNLNTNGLIVDLKKYIVTLLLGNNHVTDSQCIQGRNH